MAEFEEKVVDEMKTDINITEDHVKAVFELVTWFGAAAASFSALKSLADLSGAKENAFLKFGRFMLAMGIADRTVRTSTLVKVLRNWMDKKKQELNDISEEETDGSEE